MVVVTDDPWIVAAAVPFAVPVVNGIVLHNQVFSSALDPVPGYAGCRIEFDDPFTGYTTSITMIFPISSVGNPVYLQETYARMRQMVIDYLSAPPHGFIVPSVAI